MTNIKILRIATYTAIRGNIARRWEELETSFEGNTVTVWRWQEDFGDKEGLALECKDLQEIEDDEWFIPDNQNENSSAITPEVITRLLNSGSCKLK